MGKRDRKKRKQHHDPGGEGGSVGLLSSMRGGFQSAVGQGKAGATKGPGKQVLDVLFWVLILAMIALFAYRRFR